MRHAIAALISLPAAFAGPVAVAAQASQSSTFQQLLRNQYAALAEADTAELRRALADSLAWVVATDGSELGKSELLRAASHRQVPTPRFDVDSVCVQQVGEVALVHYRRHDQRRVGTYERTTWSRALDVFRRQDGHWLLERHIQTWLVARVTQATVDSAALAAFVGQYQIGPGYVDDVDWESGHLVATATGQTTGATLVPVSGTAFSPDGVGALIVFERDPTGRVVGYVQGLPDGQVVRAPRRP